jgi:catechol 2,3-dioxygenase-like lactoylglutathione lyase family enzyme
MKETSMTERLITHLRHVDLAVPDYDKQFRFYTEMWGLTPSVTDDGIAFLAAAGSPEQYSVRLRRAAEKRLDLIAFGAASPADVDALAAQLAEDDVQLVSEPGKMQTPGGGYGFRFFDNDGRTVEVSADVEVRAHRKVEAGESVPVKLSHVVINSPNPEATVAFYAKHLSFALSDTLMHPRMGEMMWFLRTSRCTMPPSSCAASTNTCAAPGGCCGPASKRCGDRGGTWPGTTRSAISSTRTETPSSTPPNSSSWTRTPGIRTSTTSPIRRSPISGEPRIR